MSNEPKVEFKVTRGRAPAEVPVREAQQFIDLVQTGETYEAAAKVVRRPLADLIENPIVKAWVAESSSYFLPDVELRRKVTIGAMTKIMATADEDKDKIAAARVLIKDPDMGFERDQGTEVHFHLSDEVKKLDAGDPFAVTTKESE